MTFAPEMDIQGDLLKQLLAVNAVPAFGHSNMTFEQAKGAFQAGVSHITHSFNAMRGIHHREPGPLLAALEFPDVTLQVIADGHHLAPPIVKMLVNLYGLERLCCITDGLVSTGMGDGGFEYDGTPFVSENGVGRYLNGTLIGTTMGLLQIVKNLSSFARIPFREAVQTATLNPATA